MDKDTIRQDGPNQRETGGAFIGTSSGTQITTPILTRQAQLPASVGKIEGIYSLADANPSTESVADISLELTKLRGEKNRLKDQISLLLNRCESLQGCLLYTSPSPRDKRQSRMPSSA